MNLQTESLRESFGAIVYPQSDESILELDARQIIDLYISKGAILFRGFRATKEQFVAFSNRFFRAAEHALRKPNSEESGFRGELVYDVDANNSRSPRYLHAELSYTPMMPGMCWFYCEKAPASGGETTVGDGIEVLARLSNSTRSLLLSKRISYTWKFAEAQWKSMYKLDDRAKAEKLFAGYEDVRSRFNQDGSLDLFYSSSAIRPTRYGAKDAFINALADYQREKEESADNRTAGWVTFEDETPIPEDVFLEVKRICEDCERGINWNDDECVMIDNTRIMHGRRAWPSDQQRIVHARFGNPIF